MLIKTKPETVKAILRNIRKSRKIIETESSNTKIKIIQVEN